ncbi:hypothetical protein HUG17_9457 [Dermatophagoides farinae]|uniref:Uncharacterized protein n=1 Tax=Dermatophagoides farinae TaxID=6954 RepID=A0A9D4NSW1_DERFA|nr:hypothetical protein HUG17_9457 [Dermatophagoides farinae]
MQAFLLLVAFVAIVPCMSFSLGSLFTSRGPPAAGYVHTKAYVEESPEIGIGFQKVPVMVRVPMLVFRKKKTLVTRPVALPVCQGCSDGQVQMQVVPSKSVKAAGSYTSNVVFPDHHPYDQYGNDE